MPYSGTSSVGSVRRFAVGKPSVPPRASPETTVPSTSTGRPSSAAALADVASGDELADARRRDALDERRDARLQIETVEQREVAPTRAAEAESLPGNDQLRADRREVGLRELLGLERGHLGRELDDERLFDSRLGEQLEPALER